MAGRSATALVLLSLVAASMTACARTSPGPRRHASPHPTRRCDSGVSGALPRNWRASSVHAGGVWLYLWGAVRDDGRRGVLPASRFSPEPGGGYQGWKAMVIVPAGRPVVLRVASASARRLRLAFVIPARSPMRLRDGQRAVRFVPCRPPGATYFNGGLVVAGPQCAGLVVAGAGRGPVRVVAALGRRRCP